MSSRSLRYEIGPIRPPNEAYSLLLRFTRNCPWNKCLFCNLYKGKKFEKRPVEDIKRDISVVKAISDNIQQMSVEKGLGGRVTESLVEEIFSSYVVNECYKSVAVWMYFGGKNVFIQDAHSLTMDSDSFLETLHYLKETFPGIDRITSYARARTVATRMTVDTLKQFREAGLTRLHIGLESGSDKVLSFMKKGVTKAQHIECGRKIKESGIELSEYLILGLGGKGLMEEHAAESADALNQIDPDYIRMRSLMVHKQMPLFEKIQSGDFIIPGAEDLLHEERLFIEKLEGITSRIKSDHILNLLEEVDGRLPYDKKKMIDVIDRYFALDEEERLIFRFGRRSGIYRNIDDLKDELTHFRLKKSIKEMEVKAPGSVDSAVSLFIENYI